MLKRFFERNKHIFSSKSGRGWLPRDMPSRLLHKNLKFWDTRRPSHSLSPGHSRFRVSQSFCVKYLSDCQQVLHTCTTCNYQCVTRAAGSRDLAMASEFDEELSHSLTRKCIFC